MSGLMFTKFRVIQAALCLALVFSMRAGFAQEADTVAPGAKPSINVQFRNPDLNVDTWVKRFELESRETYSLRKEIVAALNLKDGDVVADIGAGTGFFSLIFAEAVAPSGEVLAVDIAPKFIEHIENRAKEEGVPNVRTVLCDDKSTKLEAGSADIAFTCDTYHHFEYPVDTTASIHQALKEGGILAVIDFERIPGMTNDWLMGHVRCGKETVIKEIEAVGFELIEEVELFEQNYFIKFRKKSGSTTSGATSQPTSQPAS